MDAPFNDLDQRLLDYQREYLDFIDDEEDEGIYQRRVKNMIEDKRCRLVVNINDLRRKNPARAAAVLTNTFEEQLAFQKALKEYVSTIDPVYASEVEDFYIAFEGSFGNKHVTPRTLSARLLGCLVCVEGIVTRSSLVRPKVVRSVHYCPATTKTIERRYTDLTSYDPFPSGASYPTKDEDGNLLETEYGMSVYKDHQTITIQEMPEKSPAGQLPRSVDIICDGDLVDLCKPGDRVQIVGNFRCLPNKQGGFTSGAFRTIVIANHIAHLSKEAQTFIVREDVLHCRKLAKRKNIFDLLAHSLAPSIHGHEYIKKAILCLLLGGVEKILPNGTRLRGDINILLIGDPSVAKSQLLRYVLNTAPRAVTTTGRGSSGVGLTAAVTTDNETGERRLEAGAMVLADRGVVCIDEFDKMSDIDRTAIHEVMEQGRVTISKAGIHARLNARCSVLAAANPVYGKYDSFRTPMENIGLQDSLLSRFDLLFVMLDKIDVDHDSMIADHVVRMHRYRSPNEQDGEVLPMATDADMLSTYDISAEEENTAIYEKYDAVLHGTTRSKTDKIFTASFMKKYIYIAKILKPVLTQEASEKIAEKYSRLRCLESVSGNEARTQPVTVRTLETLIRLSTAHAKCRLSKTIDAVDADVAIELIQFALFKEVLEKPKKSRRADDGDDSQAEDDDDDEDGGSSRRGKRTRSDKSKERSEYDFSDEDEPATATPRSKRQRRDPESQPETTTTSQEPADVREAVFDQPATEAPKLPEPTAISNDRLKKFKGVLADTFRQERAHTLPFTRIMQALNHPNEPQPFAPGEAAAAIVRMTDDNLVYHTDGIVYLL